MAADEDLLSDYNNTCTILSYDSDLELYLEILGTLIVVYEEREQYELCKLIKNKMSISAVLNEISCEGNLPYGLHSSYINYISWIVKKNIILDAPLLF